MTLLPGFMGFMPSQHVGYHVCEPAIRRDFGSSCADNRLYIVSRKGGGNSCGNPHFTVYPVLNMAQPSVSPSKLGC